MSDIQFSTRVRTAGGYARESGARMPCGDWLTISAMKRIDRIGLSLSGDMTHCHMLFTAAQARSIAAELLACADASEAAQGRA